MIEEIFDNFIMLENLTESEIKEKKVKFLKVFENDNPTKDSLIYFVHKELSSRTYSKDRFLELCIENDALNRDLLTALFLSVHSYGHLYSYFRDSKYTFEKQLSFFEKLKKPILSFDVGDGYDRLTETFTIYRGLYNLSEDDINLNECGFCWSFDYETAKKFALCSPEKKGIVITGEVNKKDIYGYTISRNEAEIIVNPGFIFNKKVEVVEEI